VVEFPLIAVGVVWKGFLARGDSRLAGVGRYFHLHSSSYYSAGSMVDDPAQFALGTFMLGLAFISFALAIAMLVIYVMRAIKA
jgi:hypothetical protein